MQPIITQPGHATHANPDAAARQRADRLAKATVDQMQDALAFLSMIDPEAFEIAFTAVIPADDQPEDEEAFPVCRTCHVGVGIFPDHGPGWQHYRRDGITSGTQEIYNPGHSPEVTWILPSWDLEDL